MLVFWIFFLIKEKKGEAVTISTISLAAKARISAQETVPGQSTSSSCLINSTAENPSRDVFAGSDLSVPFPLRRTNPSHPYMYVTTKIIIEMYSS